MGNTRWTFYIKYVPPVGLVVVVTMIGGNGYGSDSTSIALQIHHLSRHILEAFNLCTSWSLIQRSLAIVVCALASLPITQILYTGALTHRFVPTLLLQSNHARQHVLLSIF